VQRGIRIGLAIASAAIVALAVGSAVVGTSNHTSGPAGAHAEHPTAASTPHASATHTGGVHGEVPSTDPAGAATYSKVSAQVLAVLKKSGPEAALAYLDKRIHDTPSVSGICHAVAHDLGHATLDLNGGSVAKALSVRNDVCGGGFVHGVIEQALAGSKDIARDLLSVCAPAQDGSCWHGVGHGVMLSSEYNLARATKLCREAPNDYLVARCGEGIFMQLLTLDEVGAHSAGSQNRVTNPTQAAKVCHSESPIFADTCWFYTPTVWLQLHPDDWVGVVRWCLANTHGDARAACLKGVGSRLVKYHPDRITEGARICARVGDRNVPDCFRGMGSYWSVHWKGAKEPETVCHEISDTELGRQCRAAFG